MEGSLRVKKGVVSVRIWRCARLILGCQQKSPAKRGGQQKHEELGFHLDFFCDFFFGGPDIMHLAKTQCWVGLPTCTIRIETSVWRWFLLVSGVIPSLNPG